MAGKPKSDHRTVCMNRKARRDFEIEAVIEAGISLRGAEVKALREGKGNLRDAYARIVGGRPVLVDLEITPYSHDHTGDEEPRRTRPLLLKRAEIRKILSRLREPGRTLVPLSIYFKGPWAKVELGLAHGRRKADKRQAIKEREAKRDMDRARKPR